MSAPVYAVTRTWFGQPREVGMTAAELRRVQHAMLWLVAQEGPQTLAQMRDFLVRYKLATAEQAGAVERSVYATLRGHAAGRAMDDTWMDFGSPVRRVLTPFGRAVLNEMNLAVAAERERRAA